MIDDWNWFNDWKNYWVIDKTVEQKNNSASEGN